MPILCCSRILFYTIRTFDKFKFPQGRVSQSRIEQIIHLRGDRCPLKHETGVVLHKTAMSPASTSTLDHLVVPTLRNCRLFSVSPLNSWDQSHLLAVCLRFQTAVDENGVFLLHVSTDPWKIWSFECNNGFAFNKKVPTASGALPACILHSCPCNKFNSNPVFLFPVLRSEQTPNEYGCFKSCFVALDCLHSLTWLVKGI